VRMGRWEKREDEKWGGMRMIGGLVRQLLGNEA
jgi:hypothetical protein